MILIALTEKQRIFCEEYLIDLNATQAAIRAGYKANKKQTFEVIGHQLLKKTSVSKKIEEAMAERSKRTGISQDRVIYELAKIAFLNPEKLINTEDASIRPDASPEDLACIQSVKIETRDGNTGTSIKREVRLCDKMRALEMLGRHLGMFVEKLSVSADGESLNKLAGIMEQLKS